MGVFIAENCVKFYTLEPDGNKLTTGTEKGRFTQGHAGGSGYKDSHGKLVYEVNEIVHNSLS